MIDYATLEAGQPLTRKSITMDAESVSAYTAAVGDHSSPTDAAGAPLVPPMAIAALSLSAAINALQIPGGTIHASQEIGFSAAVPVGAKLDCSATVAQNSVRRNFRFLVVNMVAAGENGSVVMEGKSTIMLPV